MLSRRLLKYPAEMIVTILSDAFSFFYTKPLGPSHGRQFGKPCLQNYPLLCPWLLVTDKLLQQQPIVDTLFLAA
jgi:hypothetical protein